MVHVVINCYDGNNSVLGVYDNFSDAVSKCKVSAKEWVKRDFKWKKINYSKNAYSNYAFDSKDPKGLKNYFEIQTFRLNGPFVSHY